MLQSALEIKSSAKHLLDCIEVSSHSRPDTNFLILRFTNQLGRGPRYYQDILAIDIFGKSVPIRNFKKRY